MDDSIWTEDILEGAAEELRRRGYYVVAGESYVVGHSPLLREVSPGLWLGGPKIPTKFLHLTNR